MNDNQTVNLKEKSVVELKAFALDLQDTRQQYDNALQIVRQELQLRAEEEQRQQAAEQSKGKSASLKAVKDPK